MDNRIALIGLLVALASVAGIFWKATSGKARLVRSGEQVDLSKLDAKRAGKAVTSFGKKATLLQFSTEVCSSCIQTSKLYGEIEKDFPGVSHIEVDITNRLNLAAHFNIMQTPTTLILDKSGMVRSRIGGAPTREVIMKELEKLETK